MLGGTTKFAPTRVFALASFALIIVAIALLPARAGAASGWQIVLDRPTPNFGAVDFVSDSEGWLPAGAGLLHTTDGGATWTEAAKLTVADVDFFDEQHGWGVGLSGAIYATSDGGATWSAQDSGTSVHLSGVEAVGASEAWVVGQYAGFSDIAPFPPIPSVLLHTTDGGSTWQSVDALPNTSYREIAVVEQNVWALAERCEPQPDSTYCSYGASTTLIRRSNDAGATWEVLDAPTSGVSDLTFANENDGWLIGSACTYPDCVKTSTIFRTTDGGVAWQAVDTSAYGTIESLTFEDARRGWAWTTSCHGGQCVNDLLSTADGGATWYQESMTESDPSTYAQRLVARNPHLYLTARSGSALQSFDGGHTWLPMQTPALEFRSVEFVTAQVGFAVSGGGIIGTTNAGADWQRLGAAPANASLLEFVDPSLGFAGNPQCGAAQCSPTVKRTTDGGVAWTGALSQPPVSEEGGVAYLEFLDRQRGWAVTQKRFFFTNDGGGTWREQRLADPASFIIGADLADATHAWAITQTCSPTQCDYELIRSIDTGVTWTNVQPLTTGGSSLQFVDRDHGWYIDQVCTDTFTCQPTLFATSDGGTTWDTLDIPSYPMDVTFTDARNGWLNVQTCDLECGGIVLHTIDGGRTWTEQLKGPLLIGDLQFADAQNGWFALASYRGKGIGGGPPNRTVLYHTSDGGGGVILPDVGAGPAAHDGSPLLPLLLGAAGAIGFTAAFALRRRRS